MELTTATVLVTGSNRGIGLALVRAFLDAGAARVYASSRSGAAPVDDERVVPLTLDVTDAASVENAARLADDVDIVVNNAGVTAMQSLLTGDLDAMQREMDTNFWGPLRVTRALAPTLARRGGGVVVTVASALSLITVAQAGSYSASKAAVWSASDGLRLELADQGTRVITAFLAATDTDMMAGADIPKNDPADVAAAILAAIRDGSDEVFVDDDSRAAKAGLSAPVDVRYPGLAQTRRARASDQGVQNGVV
ncbi:SDR family oxidoreductase [Williamsia deligens]|uniref:SDR family oxidoreductase n=1 Tax=Williamsia deligens TaxID=321325 RepID=A0ABW3G2H2_9NOCA|nr:SDR family oxidoreductase [Williamsia deligens]MCP2194790.1 NADP-dependent 3-hydroxy acid dehydrogenase YdfG [Williamsia deligens]